MSDALGDEQFVLWEPTVIEYYPVTGPLRSVVVRGTYELRILTPEPDAIRVGHEAAERVRRFAKASWGKWSSVNPSEGEQQ